MSYIVFARKWRPKTFDEVIGQEHITTTLKNAITQNRVAHAYLFCGPRGTGKTTTARLLAKAINCEKGPTPKPCDKCNSCIEISKTRSLDIIEIDAASNRGIDDIRDLRENVRFSPQYGRYKVYIIDEVHMLTPEAFNALLKTLEEPPAHVKFIFATTAVHKILPTILSRCQRFDFRRIPLKDIVSKLKKITKTEKIDIEEDALFAVARTASGSMRDAESILDQLNSFAKGKISFESINSVLGLMSQDVLKEFTDHIIKKDTNASLKMVDKILKEGSDGYQFLVNLIEYFRNILIAKQGKELYKFIDAPEKEVESISKQSDKFSIEDILYILYTMINAQTNIRYAPSVRIPLEMLCVKLTRRESVVSLAEILKRIAALEKTINTKPGNAYVKPIEKPIPQQVAKPIPQQAATKINNADPASLYKLREVWPMVIKKIKQEKMYLASCLDEAEIIEFKDNILTLGYVKNNSFHKGVLERGQNKKLVEDIISGYLKSKMMVECITSNKAKSETTESASEDETAPKPETSRKNSLKKVLSDPLIQSALDIFDGNIMKFM